MEPVFKGERVTSAYFKNWVDGPFSHERLDHVPGWTADGVLADYIVLDCNSRRVTAPSWSLMLVVKRP
jgi:hypothetical protein